METSKTQIFELSSLRGFQKYIICLCYEKKIFVRPNVGVPYTTITDKIFLVVMETSKTKIIELSSLRGIQKYIICLCYDKKIFVRPKVGVTYTITAKNFVVVMETSKTQIFEISSLRGFQKYIIQYVYVTRKKYLLGLTQGTLYYYR